MSVDKDCPLRVCILAKGQPSSTERVHDMTEPVLVILDGLQAGSEVRLSRGESRIGNGTDCTVVVADPAMQQNHFEVLSGTSTVIRALKSLALFDGSVVEAGTELMVSGQTSFVAGSTRFCLQAPEDQTAAGDPVSRGDMPRRLGLRRFSLPLAGAIAVAAGCFALFAGLGTPEHRAEATMLSVPRLPAKQGNAIAVAAAFRLMLDRSGFSTIAIAAKPDGTVLATGVLMPGDQASWQSARQWYDSHFGMQNVLVEQLSPPGSLPLLQIAAVWAGANPYVVDGQGERLRPGAGLDAGWSIERIDSKHVFVRRGTETVALRY